MKKLFLSLFVLTLSVLCVISVIEAQENTTTISEDITATTIQNVTTTTTLETTTIMSPSNETENITTTTTIQNITITSTTTIEETTTTIPKEETTTSTTTSTLPPEPEDKESPIWSNLRHKPKVVRESEPVDIMVDWYDNVDLDTVIIFENSTGSWEEHFCDKETGHCSSGVIIFFDNPILLIGFVIPFTVFVLTPIKMKGTSKTLLLFLGLGISIFLLAILLYPEVPRTLSRLGIMPLIGRKTFSHTIPASELNAGEVVAYYSYAEDTSGNEETTEIKSFIVEINETPEIVKTTPVEEEQGKAKIGEPVKWRKKIVVTNPSAEEIKGYNVNTGLPEDVSNVEIKDEKDITLYKDKSSWEIDIAGKENISYFIEYETPAPVVIEQKISKMRKRIRIEGPDDVHYENISSFAEIPEILKLGEEDKIKLYQIKIPDGNEIREEVKFTAHDTNGNGFLDSIEWITPYLSEAVYEVVIEITKAQHLDENRNFISDIYDEVYQLDDIWSETIPDGDYVRVVFELPLDNTRDITIYPRVITGTPRIEVYEIGGTEVIAEFTSLTSNEYNKVFLAGLQGSQDTFDLLVLDGAIEIDHIIDPVPTFESYSEASSSGNVGSLDVPIPTGTVEDDLLLAVFTHDSTSGTLSSPSGWTDLIPSTSTGGSTLLISYKIATASESSSYTFSSTDTDQLAVGIARFSGVDTSNPIDCQSNTNTGNSNAPQALACTTTISDTLVVRMMGADDDDYSTPGNYPPGHTGIFTVQSTGSFGEAHCAMAYVIQTSIGSTGTADFSMTANEQWGTLTVALRSAYVNEPPTTPTNIQCDGSDNCDIDVDTGVTLQASGSTDSDGDPITYFLEALLDNSQLSSDQEGGIIQITASAGGIESGFNVYSGSFEFTSALGTSTTQSIGATVDLNQAFLVVYSTGTATPNLPTEGALSGYISSPTQVTFERTTAVDGLWVSWFVVEDINNEFTVRGRGTINLGAGVQSNTAPVSGVVDPNQVTMIYGLHTGTGASTGDWQDVFANVHLTAADTVTATRDSTATGTAATIRYEVVEWRSDFNIYTGETITSSNPTTALISGSSSPTDPVIDISRSFMLASWTATQNGIQQVQNYYSITNTNEITIGQYSAARSNVVRWYVIEFPSSAPANVQRFSYNWDPTTAPDNVRTNTIPTPIDTTRTFIRMSDSTSGTGTAFRRDFNLPRLIDGTSWSETQYNPATANYDQHETRSSVIELPYSPGGSADVEATKPWNTYNDVFASDFAPVNEIEVVVTVSAYDNSGSVAAGNNNPDLELEIWDGTGFVSVGEFSVNGLGDFTIIINDLNDPLRNIRDAWQTALNTDLRIRGINFDYFDAVNFDDISYTDVFVTRNGQDWVEIGNHPEGTPFTWDTSLLSEQSCIDLRTRAIDLTGSNTYSDYYTKGCCLNIIHAIPLSFNITLPGIDSIEALETEPGTLSIPIEFNASDPTDYDVQPCVYEYNCAPGFVQDVNTPIFNFTNTGSTAEKWNISLSESLPSYITLYGNTSIDSTLQEITTSGWIASNNIPSGGFVEVWLWANFINAPGGTVSNILINHTSIQA